VALGCGVLIVLVAGFVALMFLVVKKATAGPETAVHEFLAAAAAGDYGKAYDYFSAPLKEAQTFDAFRSAAQQRPLMFKIKDTSFNSRTMDTASAELSGTVTLESGTTVPASFKLVQENGRWRLFGYHIGSE
jgi:hypothetical protein